MWITSSWAKRSRTTARATTMPAQAPSACRMRKPISIGMDTDSMQPTVAIR